MIAVYALIKFIAYSAWCAAGLRMIPSGPTVRGSLSLGAVRWLIGLAFGVAIFFLAGSIDADATAPTAQVVRRRSRAPALVSLDEIEALPGTSDHEQELDARRALDRLTTLIRRLEPMDRQVILLYLEGIDAVTIGEIVGLTAGNVATKVHRLKRLLARRFHEGAS